jgi:hypothetical protein
MNMIDITPTRLERTAGRETRNNMADLIIHCGPAGAQHSNQYGLKLWLHASGVPQHVTCNMYCLLLCPLMWEARPPHMQNACNLINEYTSYVGHVFSAVRSCLFRIVRSRQRGAPRPREQARNPTHVTRHMSDVAHVTSALGLIRANITSPLLPQPLEVHEHRAHKDL